MIVLPLLWIFTSWHSRRPPPEHLIDKYQQTSPEYILPARDKTVTFLFSDIEGSTRLLQQLDSGYAAVLTDQRNLLRAAFAEFGGHEVDTAGDGFFVAFDSAKSALAAAIAAQRAVARHPWPKEVEVHVRMGLHTGEPTATETGYVGLDVHRASRICSAGHGGQILISQTTRDLGSKDLPEGVTFRDLGVHRLKDIQQPEHLFQIVLPDMPSEFPPLKTLSGHPHNLPPQPTEIVGRSADIEALTSLLRRADVRLITLTGPGGTGKTRLSLSLAEHMITEFEDGVFFVPLASIVDPLLVSSVIAQTLGINERATRPLLQDLKEYLSSRTMLLVLDNFEQVADAALVIAELLESCPKLKVVTTSRLVLHLRGEREYSVQPLGLPDLKHLPTAGSLSQYAAVNLFIQRALAVKPDFVVTNTNAASVAEICARLDGLPLAIELAAARIKLFSPEALLARLGSSLDFLKGGARDLPHRHQTLRRAMAWSYDLLREPEQRLFRRLAVFMGGWTLEAAEAVCKPGDGFDVVDGLTALVDQSLVRLGEAGEGDSRFMMLETIREFALECLESGNEAPVVRQAHAAYFVSLAEQAEPHMVGAEQKAWCDKLESDHGNFRAVFRWAHASNDAETGLRLGTALWRFWVARGHMVEGKDLLMSFLTPAHAQSPSLVRARALHGAATIVHEIGDYPRARELTSDSLAIYRALNDRGGIATELNSLAWIAMHLGDVDDARKLGEEGLVLNRELGNTRGVAIALNNLGWLASFQSDYEHAFRYHSESLELRRQIADSRGAAYARANLGWVRMMQGHYEDALGLLDEGLAIVEELRDVQLMAFMISLKGYVFSNKGEYREAVTLCERSTSLMIGMGNKWGFAFELTIQGHVLTRLGEFDRGDKLLQEASELFSKSGTVWGLTLVRLYQAFAMFQRGETAGAKEACRESLKLRQKIHDPRGIAECLELLGESAVVEEQFELAGALLGKAGALRTSIGVPIPPSDTAAFNHAVALVSVRTSGESLERGRSLSVDEAVALATESPSP